MSESAYLNLNSCYMNKESLVGERISDFLLYYMNSSYMNCSFPMDSNKWNSTVVGDFNFAECWKFSSSRKNPWCHIQRIVFLLFLWSRKHEKFNVVRAHGFRKNGAEKIKNTRFRRPGLWKHHVPIRPWQLLAAGMRLDARLALVQSSSLFVRASVTAEIFAWLTI